MKFRRIILLLAFASMTAVAAMTAQEQLQFADGLFAREMYDMAVKEYQAFARDFPTNAAMDEVLFRIGECYRIQGERTFAERFFKRVMVEHPASPYRFKAEFRRAALFADGGQGTDAVNLFNALLAANPPSDIAASAFYYLGDNSAKIGKKPESQNAFKTLVEKYPDSPFFAYACIALADQYREGKGKEAEARSLYQKAADAAPSDRVSAEALFQLAEMAYRAGQYAESAKAFDNLLIRHPADERAGDARLHTAWSYFHSGRVEEALKLSDRALGELPVRDEESWMYLKANAFRSLGKDKESSTAYAQLLTKYPKGTQSLSASYEKALVLFRQSDYPGVVSHFGGTAFTNEWRMESSWLLAESFSALNDTAKALDFYDLIKTEYPEADLAAVASFKSGQLLEKQSKLAEASAEYRKLVEKYPAHELAPSALFASAVCRTKLEQYPDAVVDWDALISKYPAYGQNEEALFQKAMALMAAHRETGARDTLGEFIKKYPKSQWSDEAYFWLGVLFEQAERPADAESAFIAALGSKLPADQKRKIQFRLAALYQKEGKMKESASLLQELLETPARSEMPPPLLEWLARYQLEQKAFPETVQAAEWLAKNSTNSLWRQIAFYLAGKGYEGSGKNAEAEASFGKALLEPAVTREGAESALTLGQIAIKTGKLDQADQYFQKSAELSDRDEFMDIRARSYYGLGLMAKAKQDWSLAVRYFMGVAVLYDDPELTPECLYEAADAFGKKNLPADREKTLNELRSRYPLSPWTKKVEEKDNQ